MNDNEPHMQPPYPEGGQTPTGPNAAPQGEQPPPEPQPPQGEGHAAPQFGAPPYGAPAYGPPQYGAPPHAPGDPYAHGAAPQYPPPPPGQPPYPGVGHEMPAQPPAKSNLGLIIVIIGGVVIVVLIIVVLVMLLRSGGGDSDSAAPPPPPEQEEAAADEGEESDDKDDEPIETEVGEPPHALPEDECLALADEQSGELAATQTRTSATENNARCSWDIELSGFTGTLDVNYQLPFSASDSVEAASSDFEREVEWATDESSEILDVEVHENQEIDLGDEANLVFSTNEGALGEVSTGTMIVRQDNMLVIAELRVYPDWINGDESAPLEYSDISDLMPAIGASAINNLG